MKLKAVLFALLFAVPAGAEDEPAGRAVPACLKPGAAARYVREAAAGRLRASCTYRAGAGESENAAVLVWEAETASLGPLTVAERVEAVLDLPTGRLVRACGTVREGVAEPRRRDWDLRPDPEKEGRLVLKRYEYDAKGERKERTTRFAAPEGLWTPDRLEPFVAALLELAPDRPATIVVFDTDRLRFSASPSAWRALGEGKRKVGDEDLPCRIEQREQGEKKSIVYRRSADGMLLRDEAAGLTIEPEKKEEPKGEGEGR